MHKINYTNYYFLTIYLFFILSCSDIDSSKENNSIYKSNNQTLGSICNETDECIWSAFAVQKKAQKPQVRCGKYECACVKSGDINTLCDQEENTVDAKESDEFKKIPYYNQYENKYFGWATCQNTSVAMVLSHFESKIHPDNIFDAWGKDIAQSPSGLNRVYSSYSNISKIETNVTASPEDLQNALLKGNIAIVHGYFTGFGHVLVVRGYDGNNYYVNDPAGKWKECFKCGYNNTSMNGVTMYSKAALEAAVFTSDGYSYLPGWIHLISNRD